MKKHYPFAAIFLAFILGSAGGCRAQDAAAVERATQQAVIRKKVDQELLDQALAARDFTKYIGLFNRNRGEWSAELEKVALLPRKDQARLLSNLWRDGAIQCAEDVGMTNGEDLITQYDLQDRLVQLSYQVLEQTPPSLPSKRKRFMTLEEAKTLSTRLQAVP